MATATIEWTGYPPPEFAGGAVTVGNFDGVHRGHLALISAASDQARRVGSPCVAVSFDPPPHQILHPGSARPPLTTLPDRARLLMAAGADHVIYLKASPALLALSAEAFFEDILLRQLEARAVVEGYDFRFGRGRGGDTAILRTLCEQAAIPFEEVPPLLQDGEPVSSSRVRAALLAGDVSRATALLSRPYRIEGDVVSGARRGRTIGFPTANLDRVPTVIPGNGVYGGRVDLDGKIWPAAVNIGPNPTFGEEARKVEVHLIGFSGDLYGCHLGLELPFRLRDTRPFSGVEELVTQLKRDVADATALLEVDGG